MTTRSGSSAKWLRPPARLKPCGFSILELLVAMAVMAILLVLLLTMVDSGTKLWRANESRVDSHREARAALGVITRDLQGLLPATNTGLFLINQDAFAKLAGLGSACTNAGSASAVFFLSSLPRRAQESGRDRTETCQVGYFLAMDRTSASTNVSLNLYRYFRSSDPTFQSLSTPSSLYASPPPLPNSADTELLARNITGFSLKAFTLTNNAPVPFSPSPATPVPQVIEVRISAINQDAAKNLGSAAADWTDTNSPLLRSAMETFSTRITLPRNP